jgi:outer membrane protein assembly factor BamB
VSNKRLNYPIETPILYVNVTGGPLGYLSFMSYGQETAKYTKQIIFKLNATYTYAHNMTCNLRVNTQTVVFPEPVVTSNITITAGPPCYTTQYSSHFGLSQLQVSPIPPSPSPPTPPPQPPTPPPFPPAPPAPPQAATLDCLQGGCDARRSYYNANESTITASSASVLVLKWNASLHGAIIAQPVYASRVWALGLNRDMVFTGTDEGYAYGLDATTGEIVWSTTFVGEFGVKYYGYWCPGYQKYGIGGAPAIDKATYTLYIVYLGSLYALDLSTGAIRPGWPVYLFDYLVHYDYGSLTLHNGLVYVPIGGLACDMPFSYHGSVITVNATSAVIKAYFNVSSNSYGGGGVWGSGGVVIAPVNGVDYAWVASGNMYTGEIEWAGNAEKVLKLNLGSLTINGSFGVNFMPNGYPDADFGATPTVFTPTGGCKATLVATENKAGILYLIYASNMSQIGAYQMADISDKGNFISSPAYNPALNILYVTSSNDVNADRSFYPNATNFPNVTRGLQAYRVAQNCSLELLWSFKYDTPRPENEVPFTTPVVAGNVVYFGSGDHGKLYAADTTNGTLLWSWQINRGRGDYSAFFATPTIMAGKLFAASALIGQDGNPPSIGKMYMFSV